VAVLAGKAICTVDATEHLPDVKADLTTRATAYHMPHIKTLPRSKLHQNVDRVFGWVTL
jgi:hypothetical protein